MNDEAGSGPAADGGADEGARADAVAAAESGFPAASEAGGLNVVWDGVEGTSEEASAPDSEPVAEFGAASDHDFTADDPGDAAADAGVDGGADGTGDEPEVAPGLAAAGGAAAVAVGVPLAWDGVQRSSDETGDRGADAGAYGGAGDAGADGGAGGADGGAGDAGADGGADGGAGDAGADGGADGGAGDAGADGGADGGAGDAGADGGAGDAGADGGADGGADASDGGQAGMAAATGAAAVETGVPLAWDGVEGTAVENAGGGDAAYDQLGDDQPVAPPADLAAGAEVYGESVDDQPAGWETGGGTGLHEHAVWDGGFGVGSAAPNDDGCQPLGHPIKAVYAYGQVYQVPGSDWYDATVPDLWFMSEEAGRVIASKQQPPLDRG